MAADSNQPEFKKVSQKRSGPGRFDDLNPQQSMLALIMSMLSSLVKDEDEEEPDTEISAEETETEPEEDYDFSEILGFETEDAFQNWRETVRGQNLNAQEAVRTLDTDKIDFTAAAKINIPKVMRDSGNPILDVIAKHESGGDYNIAFGGKKAAFTSMTINEVLEWQKDYKAGGAKSTAVGRYQFLGTTLGELKDKLKLSGDEIFDENMQDRLALCLLDRRGYSDFLSGRKSENDFMLAISKEWASLPRDLGGLSYYHGDGLNRAHTKPEEVLGALEQIKENAQSLAAQTATAATVSSGPVFKTTV